MTDLYQPQPEHKFTFGLWTEGNVTMCLQLMNIR